MAAEPETKWKDASKRIGVVAYDLPLNRSAVPLPKACGSASQTPMRLTARTRATGNVLSEKRPHSVLRVQTRGHFSQPGFPKLVAIIEGFLHAADPASLRSSIAASESRACLCRDFESVGIWSAHNRQQISHLQPESPKDIAASSIVGSRQPSSD